METDQVVETRKPLTSASWVLIILTSCASIPGYLCLLMLLVQNTFFRSVEQINRSSPHRGDMYGVAGIMFFTAFALIGLVAHPVALLMVSIGSFVSSVCTRGKVIAWAIVGGGILALLICRNMMGGGEL